MEETKRANLAADDGNGGKGFPECRQSGASAVVAENRTGVLNSVDECDQGVHWLVGRGKK